MRLINEQQPVVGEVVEQRPRRGARRAPGEVTRVVLDAGAVAHLAHRLEVVAGALIEPCRLQQLAGGAQLDEALPQLFLDGDQRLIEPLLRGHEVLRRVDGDVVRVAEQLAAQGVDGDDALDLVAPEVDAHRQILVGGKDGERIAAHTERAAHQGHVVAVVLHGDELADERGAVDVPAPLQALHERVVLARLAEAIDARDRGHDDHVAALEQRPRRGVAHLVDLLVDVGILGDVGVGARDVCLGLVVVVVGDEVLDGAAGKEFAKLRHQLCRKRAVRRQHQRRPLMARDDIRHGERLARPGGAEHGLRVHTGFESGEEPVDGLWLIAGRLKVGDKLERVARLGCGSGVSCGHGWPPQSLRSPL